MKSFLEEFKLFLARGNVVDMAVGVVIGVIFSAIVKSFVDDIIMPPIGMFLGGLDFSNLFWVIKEGVENKAPYLTLDAAKTAGAITINFGLFINALINFIITGFGIFLIVKIFNQINKEKTEKKSERKCTYCFSEVNEEAIKCPFCTSDIQKR